MPSLDEIAQEQTMNQTSEPTMMDDAPILQPSEPSRMQEILNKILTAETGEGSIGEYLDHPMNFMKSKGLAKVLRGLTGIFGSLSLAIIDIALGTLEFSKERKAVINNDVPGGGGFPS